MSDVSQVDPGSGDEAEDPVDAAVPDLAGELEHGRTRGPDAAAPDDHERVSPKAVAILVVVVLVIGAALLWAVFARGPKSAPSAATTLSPTAVAAADAPALFAQNCATCHGPAGAGSAAATTSAGGAPVLAGRGLPAQAVARIVNDGAPGMPAFGARLTDAEIAAVAVYVASLPPPR